MKISRLSVPLQRKTVNSHKSGLENDITMLLVLKCSLIQGQHHMGDRGYQPPLRFHKEGKENMEYYHATKL